MTRIRAWLRRLRDSFPITRGAAYSVVFLFGLSVGIGTANLLWTSHAVNSYKASQERAAAAQQRQGRLTEQRLCTTLGRLAALEPPPGNASANPSRAYEQEQHATLAQLGPDVGCKGG